ncbi:nucleoside hydrolase [Treponema phagedenis]|uniref:Nucleoside hydrolase n=1 Tax=Treponema phagedenis TaxID=162 RepID=A0A0B7GSZ1_TREPH|nr:nucleoside hydrolase [Treponema phagedenis]NVP22951.1 nucleoside hydrolase [Treponema phagedenis]QEJ95072.1 nucleoside hydrolase [Treponema phagedenis]QEJ98254.1 nucleoside hydrolase [Treponema phagedenis]QEK00997.1 nucleoside hydrolase [Treponema phagedenis]QEK03765.1 nucleoside hydrolase [Treponema phagedenis]
MKTRKIIIDTDPGIDDAVAIIAAAMIPEFELLGICSVGGNKGIECTTDNALRLSAFIGKNTPVFKGAAASLQPISPDYVRKVPEGLIHGSNGLGEYNPPIDSTLLQKTPAVDFILESAKKYPDELEIIALGPLTNLALCIEQDIETMKKIKAIYSMGGSVYRGNVTPVAEFNYWHDPLAVQTVCQKLGAFTDIFMIGLELTAACFMDMNYLSFITNQKTKEAEFISAILPTYIKYNWEIGKTLGVIIHDLITVLFAHTPELCKNIPHVNLQCVCDSEIARGQTIVDFDADLCDKNAYVPLVIDAEALKENFIRILFREQGVSEYRDAMHRIQNINRHDFFLS